MIQLLREYVCMFFGHEDSMDGTCLHCGSPRPTWVTRSKGDVVADALYEFGKALAEMARGLQYGLVLYVDEMTRAAKSLERALTKEEN